MKRILSIAFILAGAVGVRAQLTAEIDVERTVVPRLELQAPLPSVVPSVIPTTETPMRLSLSEYTGGAADYASRPGGLLGPSYTGLAGASPYRGYVWGGYFPAYNLGIGAGYRFIKNERTNLGAALQFDGSSYNAHLSDGSRESVKDNTVGVQADFSHNFSDAARLGAVIAYSHAALTAPTLRNTEQNQSINDFNAALSLDGHRDHFGYGVKADIGRFSLGDDIKLSDEVLVGAPSETIFGLNAAVGGTTADSVFRYRLEAGLDMKHRGGCQWTGTEFAYVAKDNPMIVSLDPTIGFQLGKLGIDLGAKVDISSNLEGSSFHVAPRVNIAWTPSSRFAVFARSDGGAEMTDLRHIYNYSPFAPGLLTYDATFSPVNARAGFAIGPVGGFSAEIYARYASTRRAPMLAVIGQELPAGTLAPTNIKGWGAGLRLGWSCRVVSVSGMAEVLQHGLDRGFADNPDRAGILAELSAQLRPMERLGVDVSWKFRGKRAYACNDELTAMRNVSTLNLGAEYRIDERLSAFLRFENLLARRPEILPGLTSNGLHGLAGVVFKF